jgi:hypothetical protein
MEGSYPVGGKYIVTYFVKGLEKRCINWVYFYGRPWLKDRLYKCKIIIRMKPPY